MPTASSSRARPRSRSTAPDVIGWVRSHPEQSALGAVVAAGAIATIVYCLQIAGYFVMPDELGYVQQAHFMTEHLRPVLPGDPQFGSWSQLQSLVIAIPYALLATPGAFALAHAVNAVLMASTAVPAYLLTRRLEPWRPAALLVAGLTVAVPWMTLAGTLLTENVAYPTCMWALLAAHVALCDPRPRNDVLFVGAIALAYLARTQLSLLAVGFAVAVVIHEVGWAWRGENAGPLRGLLLGVRRAVTGHLPLVAIAVVGVIVAASSTSGVLLGGYAAPTEGALIPHGALASGREILAQVVLGVGVVPLALAAAYALGSLGRPGSREAHAYAALAIPTVAFMTVALGAFSVRFTAGVNDRYLFFLMPLVFVGAVAFLLERRRLLVCLAVGTAGAAALVATATMAQRGPSLVSPAAAFHGVLLDAARPFGVHGLPTVAAVLGVAGAIAVGVTRVLGANRPRQTLVLGGVLLAFLVGSTVDTMVQIVRTQHPSADYLANRDWADRLLPDNQHAGLLLSDLGDRTTSVATWWDVTFWNLQVDHSLRFDSQDDFIQKTSTAMDLDPATGALKGLGGLRFLLVSDTDRRMAFRDVSPVGARYGIDVLQLPDHPSLRWTVGGTDAGGRLIPGAVATVYAWRGTPGATATLRLSGVGMQQAHRVRADGHTILIRPGGSALLRVRLGTARPATATIAVLGPPVTDPANQLGPRIVATGGALRP